METKLERITQLSKENPDMVFTSIAHMINMDMLKGCHASTHAEYASSTHAGTQATTQAVTISLDAERLTRLLDFCSEPRTRDEMQDFCGIKTREYFRKKILVPLIESGKINLTIPDKPKSPNQKYIKST